jgi:hypothetical protein
MTFSSDVLPPGLVTIEEAMVWAQVHGEEYDPGGPLVASLQAVPLIVDGRSAEGDIANPEAAADGVRYKEVNLAFCMEDPERYAGTYEAGLVPGILGRSEDKDLVVDVHQAKDAKGDYAYIGAEVYPHVLGFVALTGIRDIVVAKTGIPGRLPQAVLVDVATDSGRDNVEYWRALLKIALKDGLSPPPLKGFRFLAHTDITYEERREIGIADQSFSALDELPPTAAKGLGIDRPVYSLYDTTPEQEAIEIVTPLTATDMSTTRNSLGREVLLLPTLRGLAA